jgi:hypothetical protein
MCVQEHKNLSFTKVFSRQIRQCQRHCRQFARDAPWRCEMLKPNEAIFRQLDMGLNIITIGFDSIS